MVNVQAGVRERQSRTRRRSQPMLGPEARDRQGRMRSMIDAAIALFAEEGYDAVSTRRVAERANCSETLLFRYFSGKRGLLLAICDELRKTSPEHPSRTTEYASVSEFVDQYVRGVFNVMRQNAPTHKIVTAALVNDAELTADFEERHDEEVEHVAGHLRRFQSVGLIAPDVDVVAIATGIEQMAFAIGFLMQILYGRPQEELDAIARSFAQALSQGLRDTAPAPLLEAQRLAAIHVTRAAAGELEKVVEFLEAGSTSAARAPVKGKRRR